MQLVIDNRVITESIKTILEQVRIESGFTLYKDIQDKGDNLMVQCPCHKSGQERHPSCSVLNTDDDPNVPRGWHHCFTCGMSLPIEAVIGKCFGRDTEFGKEWLKDHYGDIFVEHKVVLPEITFNKSTPVKKYLEESMLNDYDYYHNYMWERKLSKEVVDRFRVGYDPQKRMLTFPVWDEKGHLVMITGRSVQTKMFHIDKDVDKPVYLLNFMLQDNVKTIYVCESQVNTLYMNSLGYPAVGLIGTGSATQYKILRRCGIRNFILLFDGDEAGRKGAQRFKDNMGDEFMITDVILPQGKDVNDLSPQEIKSLLEKSFNS